MKNSDIKQVIFSTLALSIITTGYCANKDSKNVLQKPNVIFVFADELHGQDLGYNGNKDVITPNLDRLASHAINFTNTISCCPVCSSLRQNQLPGVTC